MFYKFIKDFKNSKKVLINLIVLFVLGIGGTLLLMNFEKLNNILKFIIVCHYISAIFILMILRFWVYYNKWCIESIIDELNSVENKEEIIFKYKIKLPIEKEFNVGYITKDTSYISNLLNILGSTQLLMLLLVSGFSYEVYQHYNFLGIIVACFINVSIIILFLIIYSKNDSYIKIKELMEQNHIRTII